MASGSDLTQLLALRHEGIPQSSQVIHPGSSYIGWTVLVGQALIGIVTICPILGLTSQSKYLSSYVYFTSTCSAARVCA